MNINDSNRFNLTELIAKNPINKKEDKPNVDFNNLVQKSKDSIQSILNDTEIQDLYRNKSVVMIFFDKVKTLMGPLHYGVAEAENFMTGPSFFGSTEIMRYCSQLLQHQNLNDRSKQILTDWIEDEKEVLPFALIFDSWRMKNEDILNFVNNESPKNFNELKKQLFIKGLILPPENEVKVFAQAVTDRVKSMKPNQKFKLPAGCLVHDTRLSIVKNEDGTYDVFHYNTGLGAKAATGYKYFSVPASKLENQEFWMKFVQAKLNPDMNQLNNLLDSLGNYEFLNKLVNKPMQLQDTCSFHAVEADFKHSFISQFDSVEQGWEEYKKCTSLIALIAKNNETPNIIPRLGKMLDDREKIRHRYLDWLSIVNNKNEFEKLVNVYIDAIHLISKPQSSKALIRIIYAKEPSPLLTLVSLDKALNQFLDESNYENLLKVRAIGETFPVNGVNYLGMRKMMQIKFFRELVNEFLTSTEQEREFSTKIREINTQSRTINRKIREVFPFTPLLERDFYPSEFSQHLLKYFNLEEPNIVIDTFKKMLKVNIPDFSQVRVMCLFLSKSRPELAESLSKLLE